MLAEGLTKDGMKGDASSIPPSVENASHGDLHAGRVPRAVSYTHLDATVLMSANTFLIVLCLFCTSILGPRFGQPSELLKQI